MNSAVGRVKADKDIFSAEAIAGALMKSIKILIWNGDLVEMMCVVKLRRLFRFAIFASSHIVCRTPNRTTLSYLYLKRAIFPPIVDSIVILEKSVLLRLSRNGQVGNRKLGRTI
jgi:hypothetical protein